MSKSDSTASPRSDKPAKPYPAFPLYAHATKRWAKKIRGSLHYFGPWGDPDGALKKYEEQKEALHAGRKPREQASIGVTIKELCNAYLNHKKALLDAGELSPHTWRNYQQAADLLIERFSKNRLVEDVGPDDFAELRKWMAKKWGVVRVKDFILRVRGVFKFGAESALLNKPVIFGPGFKTPTRKTIRLEKAKHGPKMFEQEEVLSMLKSAQSKQLKCMILLGLNCGFGNADCGTLPLSAVDLDRGWINYHRPKTGIERRNPLWPGTVAALREVIAERRSPKDPANQSLVFVTRTGGSWHKTDMEDSTISKEMRKLLNELGINGKRNFYALRHTFETIGGEAKDQVAVDALMGHVRDDMASVYRERISDERLKAVSDHVRKWLFGEGGVM
ncbi:MAG TPA: tyrosine-type recombinase/integrase [Gemmata sp.]|jgi:integrase|nr:tyrosine-type recombinase/integrase [Gemmata sp.]